MASTIAEQKRCGGLKYPPVRMPWSGREVPHAVVEVNSACNILCDGCYKKKNNHQKSLSEICREIDFLATERNLASLTIAGGEPLLYERLTEVIAYIAAKGIRPVVLTNGSLLTRERLVSFATNGVARIVIHIDRHQRNRPDTTDNTRLNSLRKQYVNICMEQRVDTALEITLYRDNIEDLQNVISLGDTLSERTSGVLITLYSPTADASGRYTDLALSNEDIIRFMWQNERTSPIYYLPSSHDINAFRWLFYVSFVTTGRNGRSTRKLYMHPANRRALKALLAIPKAFRGRFSFEDARNTSQSFIALALYIILSQSFGSFLKNIPFLGRSLLNRNLRMFSLLFQQGPNRRENGEYEICRDCPDATVRNGRLVPVCIADRAFSTEKQQNVVAYKP